MRPLTFRAAALAALLAAPAAHADMVIIQQGHFPGPSAFAHPMPQGPAFGMAEAFIRDMAANRFPQTALLGHPLPDHPLEPPVLVEATEADPIPFAGGWTLTEIMDDEGARLSFDPELLASTEFNVDQDGSFTAYAGCNRMFGELTMYDGLIASAEYGMTFMACFGPTGDLENAFMRVLDSASLVAIGPEMLLLLDGEGDKLAEFALRVEAP
ncbi:META domain-containing protein [Nioella aestuarii]|uniref:META domain-containing protein n=1 Tax=Nioella aestuarii TaxID=1662864 RepID=UPI003D7F364C